MILSASYPKLMSENVTSPSTELKIRASAASFGSLFSSNKAKTRSAAAMEDCRSLRMLELSLIGPENFREYSKNEEMLPGVIFPHKYKAAPKMLMKDCVRLLIRVVDGPATDP